MIIELGLFKRVCGQKPLDLQCVSAVVVWKTMTFCVCDVHFFFIGLSRHMGRCLNSVFVGLESEKLEDFVKLQCGLCKIHL